MLKYWDDEENTRKILTQDGWLKTGDQFILQENGYGVIIGRLKDMLIRGGENIFPKVKLYKCHASFLVYNSHYLLCLKQCTI